MDQYFHLYWLILKVKLKIYFNMLKRELGVNPKQYPLL